MGLSQFAKNFPEPMERLAMSWYWAFKARRRMPLRLASAEDLLWLKVRALHQLGRSVEALSLARDAISQHPDRLDLRNFIVQRELELAHRHLINGNAADALAAAEAIAPRTDHHRRLAALVRSGALRQL